MSDKEEKAAAKAAVNEPIPDFEPSPYTGKMTIRRHGSRGAGEREISVQDWERIYARPEMVGQWDIVASNVVAPHHSDGIV